MIILGSSSPRRIELINKLGLNYKIIKPTFDERSIKNIKEDYSSFLAFKKLESILLNNSSDFDINNDLVLCMDTSISKDNKIFNKPTSFNEAYSFLKEFSNSLHEVITGFAIYYKNTIIIDKDITYVYFNDLSDELIKDYINDKEINVFDKAGSYAIQFDYKYHLINKIKGSLDNVIGFPSEKLINILKELNYK